MTKRIIAARLVAGTAAATLMGAAALSPATASAAKVKFGSRLNPTVQPSNSTPAHPCDEAMPGATCSFVMNEAYGRPDGGEKAPASGVLKRVRVIAGEPGTFRLQLVKAKEVNGVWRAKVKANGPKITLQGQTETNWENDDYRVESFRVNLPIKKGWRLAMKAKSTSAIRCSSGGDNTLIFNPPLTRGGFVDASSDDGCWPLIEGVIKTKRK
jgi:hypothetical protein